LILTRILWLAGAEEKNANTLKRYIYLHGTNQEELLGEPVSHGCIRFSNQDITELFDLLRVGSEIEIH
jgi:L,D-transpeptidase YbiS